MQNAFLSCCTSLLGHVFAPAVGSYLLTPREAQVKRIEWRVGRISEHVAAVCANPVFCVCVYKWRPA